MNDTVEITGTARRNPLAVDLATLGFAATLAVLLPIATLTIQPWDEGLYCSTTVDMIEHKTILYPTSNGDFFSWYGKPPMINWLHMLSTRALGATTVGWRLPTALGMICLIILIWANGVVLGGRVVGAVAAAFALLSPELLGMGRRIWLEDMVAPFYALGMLAYAYGFAKRGAKQWLAIAGAGLAFGLAVLTKQAFALLAPTAVAITELIFRRPGWWRRTLVLGAVVVGSSLWWFLVTAKAVGQPALDSWIGYHVVARFTETLEGHGRKPNAYASSLQGYLTILPWGLAALGWVLLWSKKNATRVPNQLYFGWTALFALQYLVVGLVMKTYLDWYQIVVVLPLFVGAAYLAQEAWLHGKPGWVPWVIPIAVTSTVAGSTRVDGVAAIALLGIGATWASRRLEWLRRWVGPRSLMLAAAALGLVAANPLKAADWRAEITALLGRDSAPTIVGDPASWYAWRCYLPHARHYEWPHSCAEVERLVATAPAIVLEGDARSCAIPGTQPAFEQQRAVVLMRDLTHALGGNGSAMPRH